MGKKVLAAKSGRVACSCAAAGGGGCSVGVFNAEKQSNREAKNFSTGLTRFTGLGENLDNSVNPVKTKPSGIPWIGDVPVGWEVCKTLHSLCMPITDGPHTTPELFDDGIPFVSAEAVSCGNGSIDFNHVRGFISEAFYNECCRKYIPQRDDIYMIKSGATTGRVAIVDTDRIFTIWSPLAVFRCNLKRAKPRYVFYYLQSSAYQGQVELAWSFGTQQNIGMRALEELKMVLPPLTEQRAIADYLDEKCAAIDAAIAEAKKGIEEYKAWKISLIDDVVCNGIVRHKCRKETGEVWLEDIPGEWDFTQIRYLFALRDERNDKPLKDVNLISLYTDKGVVQHADLEKTTGNKASTADGYKLVYENDIVVNIILCWMGAVGRSAYNGVTSPAYDVYRPIDPTKVLSRYYHYLFRTPRFNGKCYEEGRGIMMMRWRTYSSEFRAIKVPVPPFEEQQAIADYLDEKCAAIDAMVAEKEALIADLEAYKKSLIYEVVTGKREVASTIEVK